VISATACVGTTTSARFSTSLGRHNCIIRKHSSARSERLDSECSTAQAQLQHTARSRISTVHTP
jgi:hypothetical protein